MSFVACYCLGLNRWARHRAIRAEDTALPSPGLEKDPALLAFIEVNAGVLRHRFGFGVSTLGTGENGLEDDFYHIRISLTVGA